MTHFHQPVDARLQAKAGAGAGAAGTGTAAAHLALWRSGGKGCFPRYFSRGYYHNAGFGYRVWFNVYLGLV
jgi:hypothetical protein